MADLTGVVDIPTRVRELEDIGVEYICGHTGYEDLAQASNPFSDARPGIAQAIRTVFGYSYPLRELDLIRANIRGNAKAAIVGRIDEDNVDEVVDHGPDLVIVGRAIMGAIAPAHAAADIREHFAR